METILAADKLLTAACQLRAVRWAIVAALAALLASTGWLTAKNYLLNLQVKAVKSDNATLTAQLDLQNAAIIRQGKDYDQQLKRAQEAKYRADTIAADLKRRLSAIRNTPLTGSCDEMVGQVIQEVKK